MKLTQCATTPKDFPADSTQGQWALAEAESNACMAEELRARFSTRHDAALESLSALELARLGAAAANHDGPMFTQEALDLWSVLEAALEVAGEIREAPLASTEGAPFALPDAEADAELGAMVEVADELAEPLESGASATVRGAVASMGDGVRRDTLVAPGGTVDELGDAAEVAESDIERVGGLVLAVNALPIPMSDAPSDAPVEGLAEVVAAFDLAAGPGHVDWQFEGIEYEPVPAGTLGAIARAVGLPRAPEFLKDAYAGQEDTVEAAWSQNPGLLLELHGAAAPDAPKLPDPYADVTRLLNWLVYESPIVGDDGRPTFGDAVVPVVADGGVLTAVTAAISAFSSRLNGPGEGVLRRNQWMVARGGLLRALDVAIEREASVDGFPTLGAELSEGRVRDFVLGGDEVIAERITASALETPPELDEEEADLLRLRIAASGLLAEFEAAGGFGSAAVGAAGSSKGMAEGAVAGRNRALGQDAKIPDRAAKGLSVLQGVASATNLAAAYQQLGVGDDDAIDRVKVLKEGLGVMENLAGVMGKELVGAGFGVVGSPAGYAVAVNDILTAHEEGDLLAGAIATGEGLAATTAMVGGVQAMVVASNSSLTIGSTFVGGGLTGAGLTSALAITGGVLAIGIAALVLAKAARDSQRASAALAAHRGYAKAVEGYEEVSLAAGRVGRLAALYESLPPRGADPFQDLLRDKLFKQLAVALSEMHEAMERVCGAIHSAGPDVVDAFGYGWWPKLGAIEPWFANIDAAVEHEQDIKTTLTAFAWSVEDAAVAVQVKLGMISANNKEGDGGENREWAHRYYEREQVAKDLGIDWRGRDYVSEYDAEGRRSGGSRPRGKRR